MSVYERPRLVGGLVVCNVGSVAGIAGVLLVAGVGLILGEGFVWVGSHVGWVGFTVWVCWGFDLL